MNEKKHLPAVDRVLSQLFDLIETHGRQLVTGSVRAELAAAREGLKHGLPLPDEAALLTAIHCRAEQAGRANLRPVFNLTGTVLHTNLGRALLELV
jgi:L-seryl-tRNA(Ser) seleniumtransferase